METERKERMMKTSCDWGYCSKTATESTQQYGETRPYCTEHGKLNRLMLRQAQAERMTRFRLYPDGRVVKNATGACLGWVEHASAYFPLDHARAPISGPSMIEDLAALRVIRHSGRADVTLLDIEVTG